MEINEDQYETLQTIFPDHSVDVFSHGDGLTIKVSSNGEHNNLENWRERYPEFADWLSRIEDPDDENPYEED